MLPIFARVTIRGNVGMAGVTITYFDRVWKTVTSDENGNYKIDVPNGWTGEITPSLDGYVFTPTDYNYTRLHRNMSYQSSTVDFDSFTISGNAGVAGALITYTGGTTLADASGNYSFDVEPDWTGVVTPSLEDYVFEPTSDSYTNVNADQTGQNFVASNIRFDFNPSLATFTPSMAKRSTSVFAASPIVQGKLDGTGTPDVLSVSRGTQINGNWYSNIDPYQGSIVFWITPEWNGNDSLDHYVFYAGGSFRIRKYTSGFLYFHVGSNSIVINVSTWVAGITYCVVCRWDTKNTLDGTNYACISIDDTHTFGITTKPTSITFESEEPYIGSTGTGFPANGIIEGLSIVRVPVFDGSYGVDLGVGDVIAQVYNAGAGKDVTEILGSFGTTFCLPTDGTAGALVTGTGNAWSAPHASNVLKNGFLNEGWYGGGDWAVGFVGTGKIDCGSDAGLDDLGVNIITIEGWFKYNTITDSFDIFMSKGVLGMNGINLTHGTGYNQLKGFMYFSSSNLISTTLPFTPDAKFHHIALTFDNTGDRKMRMFFDGVLVSTSIAATGTYISDAAGSLLIGSNFNGSIGWCRISDNARYTTDFVPSRTPPAVDANTVGQWNMSEGTGTTVDNAEGTATRDGTITNGTWLTQWVAEGTPLLPRSLGFNGSTTSVNCGSDAGLDNLADAEFTTEGWINSRAGTAVNSFLMSKGYPSSGFTLILDGSGFATSRVYCDSVSAFSVVSGTSKSDKKWHHIAMYFNDAGDRKIYIAIDGVWQSYTTQTAGVGAITSDSASDLLLGLGSAFFLPGLLGWTRISNNARYTVGTNFTPASRLSPPAPDANTLAQWNMDEGYGTVLDNVGTIGAAADGTITAGTWNNTPDLAVDASGNMVYNGGVVIYADAANEGIKQIFPVTAGDDYVVRAEAFTTDNLGQPVLEVKDETSGSVIATLNGDWSKEIVANGTFTTDTLWIKETGWTIPGTGVAHCDGSQASNALIYELSTVQLSGGVSSGELYKIVGTVSNYVSGTIQFGLGISQGTPRTTDGTFTEYLVATSSQVRITASSTFIGDIDDVSVTFVPEFNKPDVLNLSFEAPAGCTSVGVYVKSAQAGILGVHQTEVLTNLWDDGGFETGTAVTNEGSPVTSEQSSEQYHSGDYSWKVVIGATYGGIKRTVSVTSGKFYLVSAWFYIVSGSCYLKSEYAYLQTSTSVNYRLESTAGRWVKKQFVARANSSTMVVSLYSTSATGTTFYVDDVSVVALDDVSLTCTPASLINSTENGGIRVDGYDKLTQPVTNLKATSGKIKFKWTPRHSAGDVLKYGNTTNPWIFKLYKDANNRIDIYVTANNLYLKVIQNGITAVNSVNSSSIIVAGTELEFTLKYTASKVILFIDGVDILSHDIAVSFSTGIPTLLEFGSTANIFQSDGVFSAP